LIDAFCAYRAGAVGSEREPWHLVLAGDGVLRAEIERRIFNLHLTGFVKVAGYISYHDLPAYYGLAGAFVLASVSEPWGLVINEAMAAGLPVLASDRCGGAPDLVAEGRNGFTFDPYDAKGLGALMTRIASDECDRAAMGATSREIIAQWDLKRFISGFECAARMALDAPRKPFSTIDSFLLRSVIAR
jgi:1,2-diacylglycerol 3-alpha-glucosyltransferase